MVRAPEESPSVSRNATSPVPHQNALSKRKDSARRGRAGARRRTPGPAGRARVASGPRRAAGSRLVTESRWIGRVGRGLETERQRGLDALALWSRATRQHPPASEQAAKIAGDKSRRSLSARGRVRRRRSTASSAETPHARGPHLARVHHFSPSVGIRHKSLGVAKPNGTFNGRGARASDRARVHAEAARMSKVRSRSVGFGDDAQCASSERTRPRIHRVRRDAESRGLAESDGRVRFGRRGQDLDSDTIDGALETDRTCRAQNPNSFGISRLRETTNQQALSLFLSLSLSGPRAGRDSRHEMGALQTTAYYESVFSPGCPSEKKNLRGPFFQVACLDFDAAARVPHSSPNSTSSLERERERV